MAASGEKLDGIPFCCRVDPVGSSNAKSHRWRSPRTGVGDLTDIAWYVRDMPAAASAVLLGRTRLYAGDWDGNMMAWDADGSEMWRVEAEDRIERMCGASDSTPPFICATAGSQLTCHDAATGETQWAKQLVGSADLVTCSKDGSRVLATSSVYEIELNDFIESTCWRFDETGREVRSDTFEERPWHLLLDEEATATMGLGRPRCGIIRQTDENCEHISLAPEDPILSGSTKAGRTLFGHASGTLSSLEKRDLKTLVEGCGESILVLDSDGENTIFGGDDGILRSISEGGEWTVHLTTPVDIAILGFPTEEGRTTWASTWDGLRARLVVLGEGGKTLVEFTHLSRILSMTCRGDRVAIGFADGRVMLFKEELFSRRLEAAESGEANDAEAGGSGRSLLQEKLRALRKRD